jgi:putative molybdopterin biosynthesis protein
VQLVSPDVRPPSLFGVGEDDPALSRLLDNLRSPRYLSLGTREGLRRFRNGVPDVAVAAGRDPADIETAHERLGGWTREWGLLVPDGNPDEVSGLADLVDRDLRLVNRGTNSGLRSELDDELAALAEERDTSRRDITEAIDGYELTVKAHESPARKVAAGTADAGLGLRASAAKLGLDYVPLGEQSVSVLANPDRAEKDGVRRFAEALADVESVLATLDGYSP